MAQSARNTTIPYGSRVGQREECFYEYHHKVREREIPFIFTHLHFLILFLGVLSLISREKVNKRIIQGQVREFSAKCRGIVEKI